MKIEDLQPSVRMYNILFRGGYTDASELSNLSDDKFLNISGSSKSMLAELHELKERSKENDSDVGEMNVSELVDVEDVKSSICINYCGLIMSSDNCKNCKLISVVDAVVRRNQQHNNKNRGDKECEQ